MNILTVEKITKAYGERKIFDQASFYMQEGEKVGIIGINGTGKSTLLRMIAGLEDEDSGKIVKASGMVVRFLPQNPEFDSEDTIIEAVLRDNKDSVKGYNPEVEAKSMLTEARIFPIKLMKMTFATNCLRNTALPGAVTGTPARTISIFRR